MGRDNLRNNKSILLICIGFCFASLMAAVWAIPVSRLLPHGTLQHSLGGDWAQHVIGELYFLRDRWHFPILHTGLLDTPGGTSIALTDSIPAASLLAKVFRRLLPQGFYPEFDWIVVSWMLQPLAAIYALRGFGENRNYSAICVGIMALCTPVLIGRFGHPALCAQFLPLLGLGLYARSVAGHPRVVLTCLLLPASLMVHPYLFVMTTAVVGATPVTLIIRRAPGAFYSLGMVAGSLGLTVALAYTLGYGGAAPRGDYGHYGMNLLSPIWPQRSGLFPWLHGPVGDPLAIGEGFNWLGAGDLSLAVVAITVLLTYNNNRFKILKDHGGLFVVSTTLVALAVSNHLWVGSSEIVLYQNVPGFLEQARASGRFFWPVQQIILIGSVVTVTSRLRGVTSICVLTLCALLQLADTQPLWRDARGSLHASEPWVVDVAHLRPLLAAHKKLFMWPTQWCGSRWGEDPTFLQVLELGAGSAIPSNTMEVARADGPVSCDQTTAIFSPLQDGELRLFIPAAGSSLPLSMPDAAEYCRQLNKITACSLNTASLQDLPRIEFPEIPLSKTFSGREVDTSKYFGYGWTSPDESSNAGRFTQGIRSFMAFRIGHLPAAVKQLRLTIWEQALAPTGDTLPVEVFANEQKAAAWQIPPSSPGSEEVFISPSVIRDGSVALRFQIAHPWTPKALGLNPADERELGLFVWAIRIDPIF